jgi:uncharacterized protein GlcG (DUF336 family)
MTFLRVALLLIGGITIGVSQATAETMDCRAQLKRQDEHCQMLAEKLAAACPSGTNIKETAQCRELSGQIAVPARTSRAHTPNAAGEFEIKGMGRHGWQNGRTRTSLRRKGQVHIAIATAAGRDRTGSPSMRDKPCLTSSDLQKAMAACRAEAEKNKWNVSIAIVDDGGYLLTFDRMDGAPAITAEVAIGKAHTAALTRRPSKFFEDRVKERPAFANFPAGILIQGGCRSRCAANAWAPSACQASPHESSRSRKRVCAGGLVERCQWRTSLVRHCSRYPSCSSCLCRRAVASKSSNALKRCVQTFGR